jgi:hypothetical protein
MSEPAEPTMTVELLTGISITVNKMFCDVMHPDPLVQLCVFNFSNNPHIYNNVNTTPI